MSKTYMSKTGNFFWKKIDLNEWKDISILGEKERPTS